MDRLRPGLVRRPAALEQLVQKTYDDREQRGPFYKGGGKDHSTTDIGDCFGLTGDGLGRLATNKTDSDASAECGDSCSNSSHFKWI